jgi:glycosyltransferase involved in cell wall biosynthesis
VKIILISHHFPPSYRAGAEQYAYRVVQELQRLGHIVEVVCIESITEGTLTPSCENETYQGLLVHRLRFDIRRAPNQFEWSFRNPELGQWVKGFLEQARPDVVHINSGYLLGGTVPEAASELGLPTVLTLHDYWFLCPLITLLRPSGRVCDKPVPPARCVWCSLSEKRRYRLPDQMLNGRLGDAFVKLAHSDVLAEAMGVVPRLGVMARRREYLKQVLESVDLVVSPSRFLVQKTEEYGIKSRRMVYLPFGLRQTHLLSHQPGHSSGRLRIGYLGQFVPHKGVGLLLSAFQKLNKAPDACELILHGKISGKSPYERCLLKIAGNDPAITFAGPYPNSEVGQVLNELDVIVVPSVWYENRPTVIVEALATGTPVVATRLGGMAELIEHNRNGLLFEVGSIGELTDQLQRLLDEPTLLPQLRAGIRSVPTIEEEVATLVSLYESLLPTSQSKPGVFTWTPREKVPTGAVD